MGIERIVVIGASAGGVDALEQVVSRLPRALPAPVLVVLHLGRAQKSLLHRILDQAGPLPAREATDGEALQPGVIYVAQADRHLMTDARAMRITSGPKENHSRPSIDVLFRSAAYHFGARAIGIVLSGLLSDGSLGLYAIKRLGGIAVIQDAEEAAYSDMPLNAMRRVDVDYAMPASEIGPLLAVLMQQPPAPAPLDAREYRKDLALEFDIVASVPARDGAAHRDTAHDDARRWGTAGLRDRNRPK